MMESVLSAVLYLYSATLVTSMIRVVIGPSVADRMTGLNMIAAQVLAILVLLAVKRDHAVYLDVALVYDIFGFIGIMAITRYFADREAK